MGYYRFLGTLDRKKTQDAINGNNVSAHNCPVFKNVIVLSAKEENY